MVGTRGQSHSRRFSLVSAARYQVTLSQILTTQISAIVQWIEHRFSKPKHAGSTPARAVSIVGELSSKSARQTLYGGTRKDRCQARKVRQTRRVTGNYIQEANSGQTVPKRCNRKTRTP